MPSLNLPITLESIITVSGSAILAAMVAMWLKATFTNWDVRYTQLVTLAVTVLFCQMAGLIITNWHPSGRQVAEALLAGFFGATVNTWGYEGVANLLSLLRPKAPVPPAAATPPPAPCYYDINEPPL